MTKYNTMGRVLRFERTAEEVRRLAIRQQESGNQIIALELLQISLDKSPDDPMTILTMAEAYAAMGCYFHANRMYLRLQKQGGFDAICFYGMGADFFAMHMYGAARDCFMLALQDDPEADFAPDAVEMLDAIDEAGQGVTVVERKIQRRIGRVLSRLDTGRPRLAARLVQRVLPLARHGADVHSLHAFALLASGENKQALKAARRAVRADKKDVRSLCALASALRANGSQEAAQAFLQKACDAVEQDEDLQLVYQTACDMGMHVFAAEKMLIAEKQQPYADGLLHMLAVALHNSGQGQEAIRRWQLIRRIDPMDTVAQYYLQQAQEDALPGMLPYDGEVPLPEILSRLDRLRVWVHDGPAVLRKRWEEEPALEALIGWGLTSAEAGIPQAMCGILSTVADERAKQMLRDVLIDPRGGSAVKHAALAALHTAGEKGPFYAIAEDRLSLVHVSKAGGNDGAVTKALAQQIEKKAKRYIAIETGDGEDLLSTLSKVAASAHTDFPASLRAKAVAMLYCARMGQPSPIPETDSSRRKAARFAKSISEEIGHELHEF